MDNITTDKAMRMIRDSYSLKAGLATTWDYADRYYNNKINTVDNFGVDPTKLMDWNLRTDHIDNMIPQLMRTYAAWVVSQRYEIMTNPGGSKNDISYHIIANTTLDCLNYYISNPKFLSDLREIAIRMKLYNAVAQVDYYDYLREEPASRIVPHTDIHLDPTATATINEVGGPRAVALRIILSRDEALNRYGYDKVARMRRGLVSVYEDDTLRSKNPNYYHDMYDVYEWYGYDYTLVSVPEKETRDTAALELSSWLNGEAVPVDPDIDHKLAVEEGVKIANERILSNKPVSDLGLESVLSMLAENGLGQLADGMQAWAQEHYSFIDEGDSGGSRPKYDNFVYKAEFQYGNNDWLVEPEMLDYPHGQIPVSFYRNHVTTDGLFGSGPFTEVMNLHRRSNELKDNVNTYIGIASRPIFLFDLDLVAPDYADDKKKKGLINALKDKFRVLFFRSSNSPGAEKPTFAKTPPMSYDVYRDIERIDQRIREIIGPTREMVGDVSGEVSGKAFQMRQTASAKPVTDVNIQIEGPQQNHIQRIASLILEYLPYEKIANISGVEGADVVQQFRDAGESPECAVEIKFGRGMPTDWETESNWALAMFDRGLSDVATLEKASTSPIKLKQPSPPSVTGQAQDGLQGVT